ncbi:MAG: TIGR01777 family protein [Bacteroidales bacterium]|jgi:hypothetical protein|nr:TIGR01777 family protein [Bacteroidales bacterium]NPV36966.1 TIGR01777 family protein [Bacteroidales bacterium]
MKKVYLSGATGFVGSHLKNRMEALGWEVKALERKDFAAGPDYLRMLIDGCNAVIHLAGAPIARRWSQKVKREIHDSRIQTTRALSEAICRCVNQPQVFVSASAVGIYESFGIHDEDSTALAQDFLGKLCMDWEAAAQLAQTCTRVVNPRIGLVLGKDGGLMARQLPFFKLGLGGPMGSGKQGFPFIHIHDLCSALIYVIDNTEFRGPVNMVAPQMVDNRSFAHALGRLLNKPAFLTVPVFALRWIFGQGAEALANGQFVRPAKLISSGFKFKYPELKDALSNLILNR